MNIHINANVQTNLGRAKKGNQAYLSPATEYWLNRLFRDHGHRIFLLIFLFLAIIFASIMYAFIYPEKTNYPSFSSSDSVQIINTTTNGTKTNRVIINGEEIISNDETGTFIATGGGVVRIENSTQVFP